MATDYAALIDYTFLAAHDVTVTRAPKCPWQFFVSHPDLHGARFAYYPSTGSVVWEGANGPASSFHVTDEEELVALIQSKINL